MALHLHPAGGGADSLHGRGPCCRMVAEEGVPGRHGPAVDGKPQIGTRTVEIAVEYHGEVPFHIVNKIEEILLREAKRNDPVETLPENQSSPSGREQRLQQTLRSLCG